MGTKPAAIRYPPRDAVQPQQRLPHRSRRDVSAQDCTESEVEMAQQERDGLAGRKGPPAREQPGPLEREKAYPDDEERIGASDDPECVADADNEDEMSEAYDAARETAGGRAGHGKPPGSS
jgi:hypothetical protein